MIAMSLDAFKNPSTFTWIGRHASELRFLVNSLGYSPQKVLDVGGGVFEPFYFARMLTAGTEFHLVDVDESVYKAAARLNCGEPVSLEYLSSIACNKDDKDGRPLPNTDLTDAELLELGFSELELAGSRDTFYTDEQLKEIWLHGDVPVINMLNVDAREYLPKHKGEFDFAYAGIVLMNMAKVLTREELVVFSRDLIESVRPHGVLGIGETPMGLYGERGVLAVLEECGAVLTDLFLDNVVQVRGKLRGGHCLRFVRPEKSLQYSPIANKEVDDRISRDELLRRADIQKRQVEGSSLGNYLRSQDEPERLIIAALRRNGGYDIWEAPVGKVMEVAPQKRNALSLIPGLRYTSIPPGEVIPLL